LKKALKKHSLDNVATVLENVNKGDQVVILSNKNTVLAELTAVEKIPFGNKIAITAIANNKVIMKCGFEIGRSNESIPEGDLVHVHNVRSEKINFPDTIINEILRQMDIKR